MDAQPPIDDKTIAEIEKQLVGPLPEDFLDLWRTSFGGKLDYDLPTELDGAPFNAPMHELFYPESDHYFDLWGWIEAELEMLEDYAEENEIDFVRKLQFLPFAGSDYTDRIYVTVEPGELYGSIVHCTMGEPWFGSESGGDVAATIQEAFKKLRLPRSLDLLNETDKGRSYVCILDRLKKEGQAGKTLSKKLKELLNETVVNWRAALAEGRLIGIAALEESALDDIGRTDDVKAMDQLLDAGLDRIRQPHNDSISDRMAGAGAWKVVDLLQKRGENIDSVLYFGRETITTEVAERLVQRGAKIDSETIVFMINDEKYEVADYLKRRYLDSSTWRSIELLYNELLDRADLLTGFTTKDSLDKNFAEDYNKGLRKRRDYMRNMAFNLYFDELPQRYRYRARLAETDAYILIEKIVDSLFFEDTDKYDKLITEYYRISHLYQDEELIYRLHEFSNTLERLSLQVEELDSKFEYTAGEFHRKRVNMLRVAKLFESRRGWKRFLTRRGWWPFG